MVSTIQYLGLKEKQCYAKSFRKYIISGLNISAGHRTMSRVNSSYDQHNIDRWSVEETTDIETFTKIRSFYLSLFASLARWKLEIVG